MYYLVSQPLTFMFKMPKEEIESYVNQIEYKEQRITGKGRYTNYREIAVIKSGILPDEYKINMNFLGIDLAFVPKENFTDFKALIIPLLYV